MLGEVQAIVARVLPISYNEAGPFLVGISVHDSKPSSERLAARAATSSPSLVRCSTTAALCHKLLTSVFREAYVPRQHCASRWIRASEKLFLSRSQHCTAADSFPSPLGFSPPLSPPPYVRNLKPLAKSQSGQIYFSTEFFCLATKLCKSADYVALTATLMYPVTMNVITLRNQSWPHGSSSKDFLIKATLL